ncbi:NAD(P)-binding protein, partial [Pyrenophora tritici-repentis]
FSSPTKMVTPTEADTAAPLTTHAEFSTKKQNSQVTHSQLQGTSKHGNLDPSQPTRADVSSAGQKTIAVIGTSGFLGPYIIASLLRTHAGSKILCINRRPDGEQRTIAALKGISGHFSSTFSRLRFLVAEIAKPNVGMGPVRDEMLASGVDEIIFNAWNPNWSLPLQSFQPLLEALSSAIAFCTWSSRRPRITFISSICAVGEWPRQHPEQPLIPERVAWDSASAMPHGYGHSKCIAEQLLSRAHAVTGLSVAIVRAGQIAGPARSSTECSIWPAQGWLFSIIKASARTGYWPAHVQPLDWIPVDALAEGIARVTCGELRAKDVQVFNMVHPRPAPWRLLFVTLQNRFGLRAEEVSLPKWLDTLEPGTLKLDDFLRAARSGREYDMTMENENALRFLPEVMPITESQLVLWMKGWDLKLGHNRARM